MEVSDIGAAPHTAVRGIGRTLVRILLASLVILGSGELFVRAFIGSPSPQVYDPQIGYSYRPHSELFQAKEGFTHLKFNALGLNDREVMPRDGHCRVLAIGDSYTAALQVPQTQNFTSIAERLDPDLDVVNGGRDGLFLGDMHKVAARLIPEVQPDLVVYVISERAVDTDITLPDFDVIVDPRTGAVVDAVMRVERQETLKRIFGPVLNESALATRLSAQFKPMVVDAMAQIDQWRSALAPAPREARATAPSVNRPSSEEVLRFVFRQFGTQAPAALLYINGLRYGPHHHAEVASTSLEAQDVAMRAAHRAGIPLRDTGSYLIAVAESARRPPFGFDNALLPGGHLNTAGHAAVGLALVDLIRDLSPSLNGKCAAR